MSMLKWMRNFNMKNTKKNTEVRELLRLDSTSLSAADYGGLVMLNVTMKYTGSSDV